MEWLAVLLVAAVVVALAVARTRRSRSQAEPEIPGLTHEDQVELEHGFAEAERAAAGSRETLLAARLDLLTKRGVPLRAVRPAPGPHTARLCFANGTVLIGRARRPGELYALVVHVYQEGVSLESWAHEPDGTMLRFSWPPHGGAELLVGLDQAD